jgi:hypothetical protein
MTAVACGTCGTTGLRDDAKFCGDCGAPIAQVHKVTESSSVSRNRSAPTAPAISIE